MTKNLRRKIKFSLGDVFQINLPNGKYAYGRVYDDASVGIYRVVTDEPGQPPIGSRDFLFNVGMYEDILSLGRCPIIARDPFDGGEDTWPPPNCIVDTITGEHSIYHHGEIRPASEEECRGLEKAAVWDLNHIISRIMRELGTS